VRKWETIFFLVRCLSDERSAVKMRMSVLPCLVLAVSFGAGTATPGDVDYTQYVSPL